MTKPSRGRPATGRKEIIQVPMDKADLEAIRTFAMATGDSAAEIMRLLVKGNLKWPLKLPRK
jgi:hypothetical protein